MINYNDVIIKPVLSEKTTKLIEENKYVFRVSKNANKPLIKKAILEIFKVNTTKINIIKVRGKKKRVRQQYGYTPDWKKAIITIQKEQKIEIFENQ